MKIKLPNYIYVELYAEMAAAILEEHYPDELHTTEENGDVRYTERAQDIYIEYCNLVETVLEKVGIKSAS